MGILHRPNLMSENLEFYYPWKNLQIFSTSPRVDVCVGFSLQSIHQKRVRFLTLKIQMAACVPWNGIWVNSFVFFTRGIYQSL